MEPEHWINLASAILVFCGFLLATIKYSQEKKRELQKRFFEEQIRFYHEAVNYASIISICDKQDKQYKDAVFNFRRLYSGNMCVIEDREVEIRMTQYNTLLKLYETTNADNLIEIKNALQDFALILAHTCRNSSISTWEIKYKLERFTDYTSDIKGDRERIQELIKLYQ